MEWVGLIISLLALAWIFIQQKAGGSREPEAGEEELLESAQAIDPRRASGSGRGPRSCPSSSVVVSKGAMMEAARREGHAAREREKRRSTKNAGDRKAKPVPSSHVRDTEVPAVRATSPVERAVKRLAHRRDLIIYQEIMGPPKSFRPEP